MVTHVTPTGRLFELSGGTVGVPLEHTEFEAFQVTVRCPGQGPITVSIGAALMAAATAAGSSSPALAIPAARACMAA